MTAHHTTPRAILAAFCLLLSTHAIAEYKLVDKPAKDDPMAVHHYRLDNGLSVFLTANPEEPRFYAEIVVRAGSKHDPAAATGMEGAAAAVADTGWVWFMIPSVTH